MSHHVIPQRWVGRGAPHTTQNHTTRTGGTHHTTSTGGEVGQAPRYIPHSSPPHHKGVWIILGDHRRGSRCMYTYILLNGYRYMSHHVTSQGGGEGSTTRHLKPHHKEGWGSPYHIHRGRVGENHHAISTQQPTTPQRGGVGGHHTTSKRGEEGSAAHYTPHCGSSWGIIVGNHDVCIRIYL